jgi:hypothetical protein
VSHAPASTNARGFTARVGAGDDDDFRLRAESVRAATGDVQRHPAVAAVGDDEATASYTPMMPTLWRKPLMKEWFASGTRCAFNARSMEIVVVIVMTIINIDVVDDIIAVIVTLVLVVATTTAPSASTASSAAPSSTASVAAAGSVAAGSAAGADVTAGSGSVGVAPAAGIRVQLRVEVEALERRDERRAPDQRFNLTARHRGVRSGIDDHAGGSPGSRRPIDPERIRWSNC